MVFITEKALSNSSFFTYAVKTFGVTTTFLLFARKVCLYE